MIGGNPLNSHSFSRNKSLAAVLVAIAIPVFTAQLEKSREATAQANIRSAYAEQVAAYLTSDNKTSIAAINVPVKHTIANWQCAGSAAVIRVY